MVRMGKLILRLKPLLTLIFSYIVFRVLLFIGLLSGLFFSLYRYLVGFYLLRKYKHPIVFVQPLDAKFCLFDDTLQFYQIFEGSCDIDKLRQRIDERWLQPRQIDGRWKHAKLRQRFKLELGYYFWTQIDEFRIENHVVLHEKTKNLTENDDLHVFASKYSTLPLKNGTLWQFTLVNLSNKTREHHIIIFRAHHALMDEISMNRMYRKLFDDQGELNSVPTHTNLGFVDTISFWSRFVASAPYQFCRELFSREANHLQRGFRLTGTELIGTSAPMGLGKIQLVMRQTESAANDIFISCFVGALRAYFVSQDDVMPTVMRLHVPVWLHSQHDEVKMENNATTRCVWTCIKESTFVDRLGKCKMDRDAQMEPVVYFTHLYFKFYINRFPSWMTKRIVKRFSSSLVVSCLAMSTPKRLLGNEPTGQQVCLPGCLPGCGLAVAMSLDENRSLVCAIKADLGIMKSPENIDKLVGLVKKEFNELCNIDGK